MKIKRGYSDLTGKWVERWILHIPRQPAIKCTSLIVAKEKAVELGASGKWVRSRDPIGHRGRLCVVYTEVKEESK